MRSNMSPKEVLEDLWSHPSRRSFIAWMKPEVLTGAVRAFSAERFPHDPDRIAVEYYHRTGKWYEAAMDLISERGPYELQP